MQQHKVPPLVLFTFFFNFSTAPTFSWAGLNASILADPCMAGDSDSITDRQNQDFSLRVSGNTDETS
jgi:hypothetical protein